MRFVGLLMLRGTWLGPGLPPRLLSATLSSCRGEVSGRFSLAPRLRFFQLLALPTRNFVTGLSLSLQLERSRGSSRVPSRLRPKAMSSASLAKAENQKNSKAECRLVAKQKRHQILQQYNGNSSCYRANLHTSFKRVLQKIFGHALDASGRPLGAPLSVAGFFPKGSEIDCLSLLELAHRLGHTCLLPVVKGEALPLTFRKWTPGCQMELGYVSCNHYLQKRGLGTNV
eukprot:GHVT01070519.1.p1 GENE.GHVT01070519.1~~GHVT01070519.1.p1  ORF type:complete len:228 (-),score=21.78 GHVT01070519.1:448-1131(-)